MTRLMDWTDRGTCVLFGDGAGRGGGARKATRPPIAVCWAALR